jgi:hypothetical protein
MIGARVRRQQVAYAQGRGLSGRRACALLSVARSTLGYRVIEVLTQFVSLHGTPRYLRSDNGPEFVAAAILRWLQEATINIGLIDPGKPGRMPPTNRSTGSCATSASVCNGFATGSMRVSVSSSGGGITTRCGPIRVSGT